MMEYPVFASGKCLAQDTDNISPVNTFLIDLKKFLERKES